MASDTGPTYSIIVTHLNMRATVERSLRSILSQVDDEFEVLVIDGGSSDGSLSVVQRLSDEYDNLRVIVTEGVGPATLGADRNVGVREARGEHVLLQVDADDEYAPVIKDFVYVYERIRAARDEPFYLRGAEINIAPRDFLLERGPYRKRIHRGEDADLWRRLLAEDVLVQLDHAPVSESIGYDQSGLTFVRDRYSEIIGDLRSGVTVPSRLRQAVVDRSGAVTLLECVLVPLAALAILSDEGYEMPSPFDDALALPRELTRRGRTPATLEAEWDGVEIDRSRLSDNGRQVFYEFE